MSNKVTIIEKKVPTRVGVGTLWKNKQSGTVYILVVLNEEDKKVGLVSLENGLHWKDASTKVSSIMHLTEEEWDDVSNLNPFTRVEEVNLKSTEECFKED